MSEEEKDNPMECMRCDVCEACYTCQVGDAPELRKYTNTGCEPPLDMEEYLQARSKEHRTHHLLPDAFFKPPKELDPLVEFLKYIFLFKWLKVTWK